MTAVIGILNKSAAAIATDSAVTVTGPRGPKIFNRANKIFRISKTHPIGLMLYNQGEFMGTPWEPVIKQYRRELGDKAFDTLEEYKSDFIQFLHSKQFFCDVQQQKRILYFMLVDLLQIIAQEVLKEQQAIIQTQPPNIAQIIARAIETKIDEAIAKFETQTELCPEFADFTEKEFDDFGFTGLPNAIQQVFLQQGIPLNIGNVNGPIRRLVFLVLKAKNFFNFYSGLVFTGYGESEMYPGMRPINISLAINKKLRWYDDQRGQASISHRSMSAIRPFAQTDVIDTVLAGIDPHLNRLYSRQFQDFISKNNETMAQLIEAAAPDIAERIRALDVTALTKSLNDFLTQERKRNYIDPLMGAVSTLSKEDLAEMAESLVYLTYLKRRFTFAQESVGGPVDVAIITKGDGFIWIKRKHYFNPDLNHHFLKNY
jgi:hypothetical protein